MSAKLVIEEDLNYICDQLDDVKENLKGKTILITGGAGFVGYYLVKTIINLNYSYKEIDKINLIITDVFYNGVPKWIAKLAELNNVDIIKHDVIDKFSEKKFKNINYIVHAASIASPIYYRKYPIKTMDSNVIGLRNLLDFTIKNNEVKNKIESILFFSTSEIYGNPSNEFIPTNETYNGNVSCTGPRACYDESKRYGETMCVNFFREYNVPIKIVRPFNNYGPGLKLNDGRLIPDFANNIFQNKNITIFSNGSPTRTFCYIADAIVGYIKVLINGRNGESYNIGNDKPEISVVDLAKTITKIANELFLYNKEIIYKVNEDPDYLVDNPQRRCPDIKKASDELNFKPLISIENGIRKSLLWYSENLKEINE